MAYAGRRPELVLAGWLAGWRTISSAMRNFHQASPSVSAPGYYRHAHVPS